MTRRNPTIGGKGKPAEDKPPKIKTVKPMSASISMQCPTCKKYHEVLIVPGINDITKICDQCGSVLRMTCYYDGLSNLVVHGSSVEMSLEGK